MDNFMLIRSGIFLVAGLITIIFHKGLNNWKNRILKKYKIRVKDEKKNYIYIGIIFIIISVLLFIYSIWR